MAGPSGMMQRWKGRVAPKELYFGVSASIIAQSTVAGGSTKTITAADLQALAGMASTAAVAAASSTSQMPNTGISFIQASSAKVIYPLAAPVPGCEKVIAILQNSSAVVIQVSTAASASVVLDPSSNTNVLSTVTCQISLMGVTTARWAITAFYGSTAAVLTVSTSS